MCMLHVHLMVRVFNVLNPFARLAPPPPYQNSCISFVYSNQMGYHTSDFRLLWAISPCLPNPPPHTPTPFLNPPSQVSHFAPPPRAPPNIRLVALSPTSCHRQLCV